jgi:hypothetical protein
VRFRKVSEIDLTILEENAHYIAGLMDGEGAFSIVCVLERLYFRPLLSLGMNHEETVRFAAEKFGVNYKGVLQRRKSYSGGVAKETVRTTYVTRVLVEEDIKKILTALSPSLITKKKHAELILEFIDLKQRAPGTNIGRKDMLQKQAEIYSKLRRLNPKGRPFDYEKWKKKFGEAIRSI